MIRKLSTAIIPLLLMIIPYAHAVDAGYGVQPGDVLQISVWNEENLAREVLVRPDGGISFPLAGDIQVGGMTVDQVRAELVTRLHNFIPDPEVAVLVTQIVGNMIYVIGNVNRPGEFVLNRNIDVMQALSMAGGISTYAGLNKIKILRREGEKQIAIHFKYAEVEGGEKLEQNILLKGGDIVVVP